MRLKLALLLSIGLTCLASNSIAQPDTLILDGASIPVDVSPYTRYLRDPEGSLSIDDVQAMQFEKLPDNQISFGYTPDKFWLQIHVVNGSEKTIERILQTSVRFMRPLEIYLERENGAIEKKLFNDETFPFNNRPLPQFRFLAVDFELLAEEAAIFYIKFGAGGQAAFNLEIKSLSSAMAEQHRSEIITSIYVAAIVILILVNLFHYIALRKRPHLVYIFYESINALYVSHMDGFTFQYLWPGYPQWNDDATPMIASVGLIIGNYFAMVYLDVKNVNRKLNNVFILLLVFSALALFLTLTVNSRIGNQMAASLLPVSLLLSVFAAAMAMRKGDYLARYFLVAWVMFGLVGSVWSATMLGFINSDYDLLTLYKVVIAIQAIILSMGLADQVRRITNEHVETQAALIDALKARVQDNKDRIQLEKDYESSIARLVEKTKQLATTSHDINQPIQALRLRMHSLHSDVQSRVDAHLFEQILDQVDSILAETLDQECDELRKVQNQSSVRSVLVGELISGIVEQFRGKAQQNKTEIRGFNSSAVIVTYETQLKRCLNNLVSNAIENTLRGKVLIGARRRGQYLAFQIYDNGAGITEGETEDLLNPLAKGVNSFGHGLGLTIVKEICRGYGWQLDIQSVPEKGSCFCIYVPVRAE